MFSSDSQRFQNGATPPTEYRSNHLESATPSHPSLTTHVESTSADVQPLRSQQADTDQINTKSIETDKGDLDKIEIAKRAQSWQVAPDLFTSFRYAWAGITYAFQTQRNFRVHSGIGVLAIILCWTLKVSNLEVAVVCLTIGAVLVMEILNTALESLVDLTVGQAYHDLAKIAKDCAAGAVLMSAIVALAIAVLIFAPPLWALLAPSALSI
ncbi:Prokaryotic diacylglycerol kinase family [Synechococcus sp. PCC 7335]|uniref:diacylglycerol kinase family protein n=1 Tax=Synechococcus sp. (strain ATCC 29403 / PCC 7335) TaxID=91464 RepID=UPI00017EE71D|nr:diacylglycerol kinase family protein [Synechococcus sp. PCC 7335]EDX84804.1 Prokaryotic diacylglycerol kinase family [Synechococcus sp. PCC 7335]